MSITRCMKFHDVGDGVTLICGLLFKHAGPCGPNTSAPYGGVRCAQPDKRDEFRACFRVKGHDGPCKFA